MRRRSILAGMAALVGVIFARLKQPKAQFLIRSGATGPIPPQPAYVTVTQGVSQAVIQVLSPADEATWTTSIAGGGTPYPSNGGVGTNFDYVINGAQVPWNGGLTTAQAQDVVNRTTLNVSNGEWHVVFATTPANASGEIVTYIQVGAKGDAFTPRDRAWAVSVAPQLFA